MRHRLYHRVFLSMLGFVVLALFLAAVAGHLLLSELVGTRIEKHLAEQSRTLVDLLPASGLSSAELQAQLERLTRERGIQAAVWNPRGERLAFTSASLPPPSPGVTHTHWLRAGDGPALAMRLRDGGFLVVQPHRVPRPLGFVLSVAGLAMILALASIPVARALTRRLETLEAGVRRLGEGELAVRVPVEGKDELASVAARFNQTAERLQGLVEAQRRVLASASHELRSPLARLRLALELARDDPAAAGQRLDEAVLEVAELDTLVEELLLAGRLELLERYPPSATPTDVAAVVAGEATRVGVTASCTPAWFHAEERLLRVMVRNLLENARRHGGGEIEAGVEPIPAVAGAVRIWVADRGPGVPEGERDRIFEPFYRPNAHAEGRGGGVGLGLYLVRRIARACGGDAICRPRDGGGTLFEVGLGGAPVHEQPAPAATAG